MKISNIVLSILMVSFIAIAIGLVVTDFNTNFPSQTVVTNTTTQYDRLESINRSATSIQETFKDITSEQKGWFGKLTEGMVAIPQAIVDFVGLTLNSMGFGTELISQGGLDLGIPAIFITFGIVAFFVFIIFKLVSFWHKYPT